MAYVHEPTYRVLDVYIIEICFILLRPLTDLLPLYLYFTSPIYTSRSILSYGLRVSSALSIPRTCRSHTSVAVRVALVLSIETEPTYPEGSAIPYT